MLWQLGERLPVTEIVAAGAFIAPPAVSSDGQYFAVADSVGDQPRVTLYSVADGRRLGRFNTDAWQDWALAADAAFLAVVDGSRRGRLLDPSTGEVLADFFHEQALDRVVAVADRVLAVDSRGQIVTWPFTPGHRTLTPVDGAALGNIRAADGIELAADRKSFAYVDANGLVNLSALEDGDRLAVFDHGDGDSIAVRLSPGTDRLVSAAGSSIRSWRVPQDATVGQDFGDVSAVALDPGGTFAVLGHRSGKVELLRDLAGSIEQATSPAVDYFGHHRAVTSLSINATGDLVASGASDGLVRVWNAATGLPRPYLLRHPSGPIDALAFSPDNRWLISTAVGSARVFDLESGERVNEIEVDGAAQAVAFAPDSRTVAVGDSAGNIVLAAPDGSQGILTIRGRSPITALRYAGSSSVLASGTRDGNLVIWDTLDVRATDGAYTFAGPIRWIGFLDDFEDVYVQSGAWLHQLDRRPMESDVIASSLLPVSFRNAPALEWVDTGSIRALAHAGGGRMVMADFDLSAATPVAVGPSVERRDWRRLLGLEIDPETGTVRPSLP
jgi:WD40 repeat protein